MRIASVCRDEKGERILERMSYVTTYYRRAIEVMHRAIEVMHNVGGVYSNEKLEVGAWRRRAPLGRGVIRGSLGTGLN